MPCGAFAENLPWADLELGQKVLLQQELLFPNLQFVSMDRFAVLSVNGIEGLSMLYLEAKADHCADAKATADTIVVLPKQTHETFRDRSVMVELKLDCTLGIYIEGADFYSPSFFNSHP